MGLASPGVQGLRAGARGAQPRVGRHVRCDKQKRNEETTASVPAEVGGAGADRRTPGAASGGTWLRKRPRDRGHAEARLSRPLNAKGGFSVAADSPVGPTPQDTAPGSDHVRPRAHLGSPRPARPPPPATCAPGRRWGRGAPLGDSAASVPGDSWGQTRAALLPHGSPGPPPGTGQCSLPPQAFCARGQVLEAHPPPLWPATDCEQGAPCLPFSLRGPGRSPSPSSAATSLRPPPTRVPGPPCAAPLCIPYLLVPPPVLPCVWGPHSLIP